MIADLEAVADAVTESLKNLQFPYAYRHRMGCGGIFMRASESIGTRADPVNKLYSAIKWIDSNGLPCGEDAPQQCPHCLKTLGISGDYQESFEP